MFKRFYNTAVDLYNDFGDMKYTSEKSCVYLGSIMADIQPFRVGTIESLKKKEYGFAPDSTKKLFCADNDLLKQGVLLEFEGVKYRCAYVEKRLMGMMAVVRQMAV